MVNVDCIGYCSCVQGECGCDDMTTCIKSSSNSKFITDSIKCSAIESLEGTCEALTELYKTTNGENWVDNTKWTFVEMYDNDEFNCSTKGSSKNDVVSKGEGDMKLKIWLKTKPINQNLIVFYYVVRKKRGGHKLTFDEIQNDVIFGLPLQIVMIYI